ncbi:MAG: NAD-dependent malic enzyme [Actinobacteria bacterium]|nr:NAD-dependent malic enzyme [Actinomycetota bacterium]MCB8996730.1 NAD-dependent malic enzyme [Actinomycetota bacterium]MCB9415081.1 NAD-dependent malic enzyme [Actinomycetota bacterium]MCB9425127.1 NAD-dependent malic enzyme [Actinomycetota bacterium]HRY09854.1 NAD-dependent malic enzyme [Candidatus Nanopelagicales bacterium]
MNEPAPRATTLRGQALLADPRLNKQSAFTDQEREELGLVGLLPQRVETIDQQLARVRRQLSEHNGMLAKNVYLRELHDRNETLFYRLLIDDLPELMPIVYTPTVGEAIREYSHAFRRPRGVYLQSRWPEDVPKAFANLGLGPDDVDLIVATDSEAILGIGDWGVGGIDIAIGKISVYVAAAGVDPERAIPVVIDVGTDRTGLLTDPGYLGEKHARLRGAKYDDLIDRYVTTATEMFPNALLHWEDFGEANARRILDRYRDRICTFNDDMQGTGAIAFAAILSGVKVTETPLADHRVIVFGAGTAGVGIADQIRDAIVESGFSHEEACRRIWLIDRPGLLHDEVEQLRDYHLPYARPAAEVRDYERDSEGNITLLEAVRRIHPTILVGTSTVHGAFSEQVVREMHAHVQRPFILPMSNPTALAEAEPADLLHWTDGQALIVTGSPFDPVKHEGVKHHIGQANNALLYPGLGLGAIVARATQVTDGMLNAAAKAVADLVEMRGPGSPLLPEIADLRATSAAVAAAVVQQAIDEGVARAQPSNPLQAVLDSMWKPRYRHIVGV